MKGRCTNCGEPITAGQRIFEHRPSLNGPITYNHASVADCPARQKAADTLEQLAGLFLDVFK